MASYEDLLASLPEPTPAQSTLLDLTRGLGQPHEMGSRQVDMVREHLTQHFSDFVLALAGPALSKLYYPPFHDPVCQLAEQWGTPGWKRIMAQLPRGSCKTSYYTRLQALWRVVRDPNTTIVIINEKVERVEMWLLAIQDIVASNPLFKTLWGHLIPPGVTKDDTRTRPRDWKWSSRQMNFVRNESGIPEATISALGISAASAGGHWQWIFHDDLLSDEAMASAQVMMTTTSRLRTSIFLGPSPEEMNAWINCTRWHYRDTYHYAQQEMGFRVYRRAALEGGKTTHPGIWTTGMLLELQEKDPVHFAAQMQNQPIAGENLSFKPEHLRKAQLLEPDDGEPYLRINDECYDPTISEVLDWGDPPQTVPLRLVSKILLVDPAPTTGTELKADPHARTAMVLKGIDPWGRRYWLDAWAGREDPISELRRMFSLMEKWGTDRVAVEEVNFSKLYAPFLRYMADAEQRVTPRYTPLKPGRREKDYRISGLARSCQQGWEYVLPEIRPLVIEEATVYIPNGASPKDLLDAASYDRDPGVLGRPESPDEQADREWAHRATRGGGAFDPYDVAS